MSSNRIIVENEKFPIEPGHIDASRHMCESFDHMETEVSAGWIVRFCQQRGQGWSPFTKKDIEDFYAKKYSSGFRFNRLIEPQMVPPSLSRAFAGHIDPLIPKGGGWIVKGDDDKFYITVDFVTRCYRSQPKAQIATS